MCEENLEVIPANRSCRGRHLTVVREGGEEVLTPWNTNSDSRIILRNVWVTFRHHNAAKVSKCFRLGRVHLRLRT